MFKLVYTIHMIKSIKTNIIYKFDLTNLNIDLEQAFIFKFILAIINIKNVTLLNILKIKRKY